MSPIDKAGRFRAGHVPGRPLVLYNIWDAGSAATVAVAGALAIATSSWSMAAAQGYADGEAMPFDLVTQIVGRIALATDLPLTVDLEGGHAAAPADVAAHVGQVIAAGAIGINFEDQVVNGEGLHPIDWQMERIEAIRRAAEASGVALFLNARTDLFLQAPDGHAALVDAALARQAAYSAAGADGFFVPGLADPSLVADLCRRATCPINVMATGAGEDVDGLAGLGVARVSFGPLPYRAAQKDLSARSSAVLRPL